MAVSVVKLAPVPSDSLPPPLTGLQWREEGSFQKDVCGVKIINSIPVHPGSGLTHSGFAGPQQTPLKGQIKNALAQKSVIISVPKTGLFTSGSVLRIYGNNRLLQREFRIAVVKHFNVPLTLENRLKGYIMAVI